MREALFMTCLVLTMSLSGCFGSDGDKSDSSESIYPDIYSRHTLDWNWSDSYSYVLEPGPHTALEVQEAFIEPGFNHKDEDDDPYTCTDPETMIQHIEAENR